MNEMKPEDVMRCVDCLHHDACEDWANGWGIETNFPYEAKENLCEHFQPKALLREKDAEIERLNTELQAMRGAANSLKMHLETARAEAITELEERTCDLIEYCDNVYEAAQVVRETAKQIRDGVE